MLTVPFLYNV